MFYVLMFLVLKYITHLGKFKYETNKSNFMYIISNKKIAKTISTFYMLTNLKIYTANKTNIISYYNTLQT